MNNFSYFEVNGTLQKALHLKLGSEISTGGVCLFSQKSSCSSYDHPRILCNYNPKRIFIRKVLLLTYTFFRVDKFTNVCINQSTVAVAVLVMLIIYYVNFLFNNLSNIKYSNIKFQRSYLKLSIRRNREIYMTLFCHIACKIMVCGLFWVLQNINENVRLKVF